MLLLLVFSFSSCEFESTETWLNEVPEAQGEIPTAELSFKDAVVYIDKPTLFEYSLTFQQQKVYLVEFYLDFKILKKQEGSKGSVLLDPSAGEHHFEMRVYTSTASGSIADKVGVEVFSYQQSWTIRAEDESAADLEILNIAKSGGSVLIEWEKYTGYKFESYELLKKTNNGNLSFFTTSDKDVVSCQDPYYIGGTAEYFLRFTKSDGGYFDSEAASFTHDPGRMALQLDVDNNVIATWSPCEFETNFGQYQLKRTDQSGRNEIVFTSNDVEDTMAIISVFPNRQYEFEMECKSKMPQPDVGDGTYYLSGSISTGDF